MVNRHPARKPLAKKTTAKKTAAKKIAAKKPAAKKTAAKAPSPTRAREVTTDLRVGFGPVRWVDTEATLTRATGLTRSSMSGWKEIPTGWSLRDGYLFAMELRFHADSGRLLSLQATWRGDDEGNFDAWFTGDAPRVFEDLLASTGCRVVGHGRAQSDPAKLGQIGTLGEGDGDVYEGPAGLTVTTFLNFDPPEFALTFTPPRPSLDEATIARALDDARAAVERAGDVVDTHLAAALARATSPDVADLDAPAVAMDEYARRDTSAVCALARATACALRLRAPRDTQVRGALVDAMRADLRDVFVRCGDDLVDATARATSLLPPL